jgi:hypothetical protein
VAGRLVHLLATQRVSSRDQRVADADPQAAPVALTRRSRTRILKLLLVIPDHAVQVARVRWQHHRSITFPSFDLDDLFDRIRTDSIVRRYSYDVKPVAPEGSVKNDQRRRAGYQ